MFFPNSGTFRKSDLSDQDLPIDWKRTPYQKLYPNLAFEHRNINLAPMSMPRKIEKFYTYFDMKLLPFQDNRDEHLTGSDDMEYQCVNGRKELTV